MFFREMLISKEISEVKTKGLPGLDELKDKKFQLNIQDQFKCLDLKENFKGVNFSPYLGINNHPTLPLRNYLREQKSL